MLRPWFFGSPLCLGNPADLHRAYLGKLGVPLRAWRGAGRCYLTEAGRQLCGDNTRSTPSHENDWSTRGGAFRGLDGISVGVITASSSTLHLTPGMASYVVQKVVEEAEKP